ncbi:MAG: adenylate/guanylate cyclase domain-containing response regulator [Leptospirales bacterium]|nr:adenylate/guanylate cyclase domain-containing response regulator [Leptospirales bacterium]
MIQAKVLLVDDNPEQISDAGRLLELLRYEVAIAQDAKSAVNLVQTSRPDICVIDVSLNGQSGIDLIHDIRRISPETTPVLMASDLTENLAVEGLSAGAEDIVAKPLRVNELGIRIQNIMKLKNARGDLKQALERMAHERTILSKYFSEDFVEQILSERISPELGGARMPASMFFFDIRNSTSIAERMSPDALAKFLSQTFTDIMDLVFANHGSVNKFTGDGMLVTFGCPVPAEDDALRCVKTAFAIRSWIDTYNEFLRTELGEPLGFGIGIASGHVFAGNIGSFRRMEYSILGDPVNSASRIQDLTKKLKTDILLDGPTHALVKDTFKTKRIGKIILRGRHEPTEIYGLEPEG